MSLTRSRSEPSLLKIRLSTSFLKKGKGQSRQPRYSKKHSLLKRDKQFIRLNIKVRSIRATSYRKSRLYVNNSKILNEHMQSQMNASDKNAYIFKGSLKSFLNNMRLK